MFYKGIVYKIRLYWVIICFLYDINNVFIWYLKKKVIYLLNEYNILESKWYLYLLKLLKILKDIFYYIYIYFKVF